MLAPFAPIAVLAILTILFGLLILGFTFVIGPSRPTPVKSDTYESGLVPIGPGRRRMPVRFYLTAALFILFDIEIVYLFPWAVSFRTLAAPAPVGIGPAALWTMAGFIAVLSLGLAYVWRKGVLDWGERERT